MSCVYSANISPTILFVPITQGKNVLKRADNLRNEIVCLLVVDERSIFFRKISFSANRERPCLIPGFS